MPDKFYDVVVIGRGVGALATAALLARRDFTVLVVGHGQRRATYHFDGLPLRRRATMLLAATTPVWRNITAELAQSQTWRRRLKPLSPMMQIIDERRRYEVSPDGERFGREIEREFDDCRRLIGELYENFARVAGAADDAFGQDVTWPPGTFLERRATGRVAALLPYARGEPHADLLGEFPSRHPYRTIVRESVRFATDLAGDPPAFSVARLHAAWTRGVFGLDGGEAELEEMLLERVAANGGEVRLDERALSVETRKGGLHGVVVDGDDNVTGAGWVVTDLSGEAVATLAGGRGVSKRAQRDWPRVTKSSDRWIVSLLVRDGGVPKPLGREVLLLVPDRGEKRALHLQRTATGQAGLELLVAEVLGRERDTVPVGALRRWVVTALCRALPFLERHLLLVDSPHDGQPLWSYRAEDGARAHGAVVAPATIPRRRLVGGSLRPEVAVGQIEVDPPGFLGLGGEPLRGPVARTLLVGKTVLPGLGQEGELLAAWSAARLVTKSDRRKARIRRAMWTKMEIG